MKEKTEAQIDVESNQSMCGFTSIQVRLRCDFVTVLSEDLSLCIFSYLKSNQLKSASKVSHYFISFSHYCALTSCIDKYMVLQCSKLLYCKVSSEFQRQDSQSSCSFGKIQHVGETGISEEKI